MPLSVRAQAPRLATALACVAIFATCGPDEGPAPTHAGHPTPAAAPPTVSGQLTILDPYDPQRPYFYDFGNVPYGDRVRTVFTLANTGQGPVTILRAQPACSCTRVRGIRLLQDDAPPILGSSSATDGMLTVPQGAVCELEIELDTTKTHPNQDKLAVMRIVSDDAKNPYLTLEIHILAERLFELNPATVNLGDVPQYGGAGKTIQIYNRLLDKPARLLDVVDASPGLDAKLEPIQGSGVPFWNLTVRLEESDSLGGFHGKVVLSHSNSKDEGNAGRLSVDVFARVSEPILLSPSHLSLGGIALGSSAHVKMSLRTLLPGQRTRILSATIQGPSAPHLYVETKALGEDAEGLATVFDVVVRSRETLPAGRIDATLILEMDDPQVPRIERKINGLVR